MRGLVDRILAALRTGTAEDQGEALLRARFCFEKWLGRAECGWTSDVIQESLSEQEVTRLKEGIIQYITAHLPPPPVASAVFALDVLADRELLDLFRRCLKAHLHGDAGVLGAALLALDNLGEELLPREDGQSYFSARELERNRDLAVRYLRRIGDI
jgi:hypothetical protein